jgi:hypothetical protein
MSMCTSEELFTVDPATAHPLVGHADSDTLVQYPKFDTISKNMVLTKARAISDPILPDSSKKKLSTPISKNNSATF